jgi:hypothetical protein
MYRRYIAVGTLCLVACHKQDPKIAAMDRYQEARDCYEAIIGYKHLADATAPTDQYDSALNASKSVIDDYEAKASESVYKLQAPGDAYKYADMMLRSKFLLADTDQKRADLRAKYLRQSVQCSKDL